MSAEHNEAQPLSPEQETIARLEEKIANLEKENAELKEENKRMEELATRDPLTNTLNRRGFKEAAGIHLGDREKKPLGVLALDIDNFKYINDIYGHAEGDRILREAADFLKGHVRGSDIVARIGGEEFAIIYYGIDDQDVFNKFFDTAEKRSRVGFQTNLGGVRTHISFSGGITMFKPEENIENLDDALSRADTALYTSKNTGRDRLTLFTEKPQA
jgi:diguanylate cyclase (GGDEF)-like protein